MGELDVNRPQLTRVSWGFVLPESARLAHLEGVAGESTRCSEPTPHGTGSCRRSRFGLQDPLPVPSGHAHPRPEGAVKPTPVRRRRAEPKLDHRVVGWALQRESNQHGGVHNHNTLRLACVTGLCRAARETSVTASMGVNGASGLAATLVPPVLGAQSPRPLKGRLGAAMWVLRCGAPEALRPEGR